MAAKDEFLVDLYDQLHDTPLQRKFRRIRPLPVGVVFLQWPGMDWDDIREHLRLMKKLGYTCLKGIGLSPGYDTKTFMHMALDEGIIPWWYGEGGWEAVTDELLARLGIPADMPIEQLRQNQAFLAYQEKVMRDRIDGMPPRGEGRAMRRARQADGPWRFSAGHELASRHVRIEDDAVADFTEWLKRKYGTLDKLKEAWNTHHVGIGGHEWTTWAEAVAQVRPGINDREYNRLKDVIRFKAEVYLRQLREGAEAAQARDPNEPTRAGGEMSLFLPLTGRGVDMEGVAAVMADHGSFYPSTHPAWHFDTVAYELTRTVYMYSSLIVDWFKGGWAATWESTGGPQQISGDKGWCPEARRSLPAYTVDEGVMTQLMLTYLAAGYRGFGFWCWSARTCGREGGEYSLLDRNNRPGPRAVQVGRVARAARSLRDELWQGRKEPMVGVCFDPENEIQWSVMADFGRDIFPDFPIQARVGAARALINANVPWEHVTASNLRKGIAPRYRIIYLPAIFALSTDVFRILADYVAQGGRLVMDMPGAYFDEHTRITDTGEGSAFEALFGATIDDYQYSSNVPRSLDGRRLTGFVVDMTATNAKVLAAYDNGKPAVTEHACGDGTAVILGYEASLMCAKPGDDDAEKRLVKYTLGERSSPYACQECIAYRLAAPAADHYFLINDGPAVTARLDTKDYRYTAATDPVTGEELPLGGPIAVAAYSGRWLRLAK